MVNFEGLEVTLNQIAGVGLSAAASLSILCVFLFLVHVVYQIEFNCTCTNKEMLHCWIYMIGPGVIIGLATLWADKRFRRIYRFSCNRYRDCWCSNSKGLRHFGCTLFLLVLKAVFPGLFWVVSLLSDGDWFACCYNNFPSDERMIPCKGNDQLNFTEKMSLREQKNTSMVLGFGILGAMLVVIISSTCRLFCKCCFSNYYFKEFEDNLLEEVEIIFAKKLKNISKGYITEKIHCNPKLDVLQYDPDEENDKEIKNEEDANPGTSGAANPGTSGVANPGTSGAANPGTSEAANPGTSGAANPGTSGAANPGTSLGALGSSGAASIMRGASRTNDLVKNVNTIDWEELSNMYFHLMDDLHEEVANTPSDTTGKEMCLSKVHLTCTLDADSEGAAGARDEEETAPYQSGSETRNLISFSSQHSLINPKDHASLHCSTSS